MKIAPNYYFAEIKCERPKLIGFSYGGDRVSSLLTKSIGFEIFPPSVLKKKKKTFSDEFSNK